MSALLFSNSTLDFQTSGSAISLPRCGHICLGLGSPRVTNCPSLPGTEEGRSQDVGLCILKLGQSWEIGTSWSQLFPPEAEPGIKDSVQIVCVMPGSATVTAMAPRKGMLRSRLLPWVWTFLPPGTSGKQCRFTGKEWRTDASVLLNHWVRVTARGVISVALRGCHRHTG